ncbi:uracil phosphoribosyltransferase [Infirmifilum lucidum]|uniref:Uracil phosphoribosyltransferase n=1 Tax=Infirmifilum lucidum TaxID=2776706 RepID=A0A7L9FI18_9CREN|nr:uracil phosphoribosyltransferase [Infirmifilum lucidum]QOJ78566.1 uracil phosphoribosyltransferase [Infirmifilum lucidum]
MKVIEKPAAKVVLTRLRDKTTPRSEFRRLMYKAGIIAAYEISSEVQLHKYRVRTPLDVEAEGYTYCCGVSIIAVLRAALPMAWGMLEIFEDASVGFVAARREEVGNAEERGFNLNVHVNYMSIPINSGVVILVDPMLATGSTLSSILRRIGGSLEAERLIVSTLIATKEGVRRVFAERTDATIYAFSVDPGLNSRAFIVPGLGDAGDRAFG